MGRTALIIAVSYGILGVVVVAVLGAVVWSSTVGRRREMDAAAVGEREKTWFGVVVVALVALLFGTIFFTPYGRSAGRNGQRFEIVAQQFAWTVPAKTLRAGTPVDFRLTSKDVSHGFAVFNAQHVFLFQVQVMPGKTQAYAYTFKKAGTYYVECWEYCGDGHAKMLAQFTVNA